MKVVVTLALCLCSVIGCALWSGVFLSTLFYLVLFCTQLRGQKKTGKKKKFRESATFNVKLHTAHQIQPNDCHKHRVFTHPLAIKVIMIFKHSLCDLVFIGWDYALSLQLFAFFFAFSEELLGLHSSHELGALLQRNMQSIKSQVIEFNSFFGLHVSTWASWERWGFHSCRKTVRNNARLNITCSVTHMSHALNLPFKCLPFSHDNRHAAFPAFPHVCWGLFRCPVISRGLRDDNTDSGSFTSLWCGL